MNVHISYRLHKTPAVEKDIQHQIEKLRKRLQVFRPELVHLKGTVEQNLPREGTSVSLNLRLPSGQMAVQAKASTAEAAIKSAFEDLLQQVNRHKELLRSSHKWQRGAGRSFRARRRSRQVPFEQTLAARVSAHHFGGRCPLLCKRQSFPPRPLRRARNLFPRGAGFDRRRFSLSKEEVIDETIAAALGDAQEKPERLALEPWLYRLALRALDELSRTDESNGNARPLEDSARPRNVKASDEAELQFHQPDESITGDTIIADARVATPEQIMASDELLRLIASALRDLGSGPREAFILHALEGFSVEEIAGITGLPGRARARLRFCRTRPPAQSARAGQSVSRAASLRPAPLKSKLDFWGGHS